MKGLIVRLAVIVCLFFLARSAYADARDECIAFCIANQIVCVSNGGTWHLNCGDVSAYWIEATQTCEIGVGPCTIIQ